MQSFRYGIYTLVETPDGWEVHKDGQKVARAYPHAAPLTLAEARETADNLTLAQIKPGTKFRNAYNPDVIETALEVEGISVYVAGHPFGYWPVDIGEIVSQPVAGQSPSPLAGPTPDPADYKQISFF